MTELEQLRLYLRDKEDPRRFSNEDLQDLLITASTIEGAAALGWLLTAADAVTDPVTRSVGNTSESWGQSTEKHRIAMTMSAYWQRRDREVNGDDTLSKGLWWELVPAENGGIIGRLFTHQDTLEELSSSL